MKIKHAWCIDNNGYPINDNEVKRYIEVKPSKRQLMLNEMKYYNFIHFGMNTFTDKEWGDGTDSASLFNPTALDTDQWCRILKSTGSKGIILTAKHHDGFCLFDTKYTDYNCMNSPLGKDVLKLLQKSCEKYALKLGVYLSPWDRHEKTYGTDKYNDFYVNQLTELCTNYGELFCLWFDGACGEGENGKKQIYNWSRYYETIRKLQPNAVIAISGPDVRWIGNEAGKVRKSEWSVIPWTDKTIDEVAKNSQKQETEAEVLQCFDRYDEDLGSRAVLKNKGDLHWSPAEADLSVTLGWFYHDSSYYKSKPNNGQRTPEYLADVFCKTVGSNAYLLLNVPPDKTGQINTREIKTLNSFSEIIQNTFRKKVEFDICTVNIHGKETKINNSCFTLQNDEAGVNIYPSQKIKTIWIEENISFSQRVEEFSIFADEKLIDTYTVIGSGKIIRFPKELDAKKITIIINQSRSNPVIKNIELYN